MSGAHKSECPGGAGQVANENSEIVAIIGHALTTSKSRKDEATLKARFAQLGHELYVVNLADGRRYYEVRRWGQARMFSSAHGLEAFLAQIGGAA